MTLLLLFDFGAGVCVRVVVANGEDTGEERLAYAEGFKRPSDVITNDDVVELAAKVAAAA